MSRRPFGSQRNEIAGHVLVDMLRLADRIAAEKRRREEERAAWWERIKAALAVRRQVVK